MLMFQKKIQLPAMKRGCHLITSQVLSAIAEVKQLEVGLLHCFLMHTSASLTINENADPDVRRDLEMSLNEVVPETLDYVHTIEGPDDMPAHVKSSLVGCEVTIPISGGRLNLGTWQGIYLCEHRNDGTPRSLVLTATGLPRQA
jgi:secondary thiamine-phosphate synthase enzyme